MNTRDTRNPPYLQRVFARSMHEVKGHTQDLRDANRAVRRLALHFRRARQHVSLWPSEAPLEHLLLELKHELAVLCVDRGNGTQLVAPRATGSLFRQPVIAHVGRIFTPYRSRAYRRRISSRR